ncbi:MAG: methionine biosynthesis protein MetW [Coriobacteriales bacterium]|nr:methionine biosynthesis protein MetW [Coriobacteriales bacterium]
MPSQLRADLMDIAMAIPEKSRVLDLGCGDGDLLAYLRDERGCVVRGVEIDEEHVMEAVAQGVPVMRADLDDGLAMYQDQSFDYVVLSMALQEVRHPAALMTEILRVGRHALVSYPNFAHWRVRWYLMLKGRMPVSKHIPYSWHETPSIHHTTIPDFAELVGQVGGVVENSLYLASDSTGESREVHSLPRWRAESVIALVGRPRCEGSGAEGSGARS